MKKLILLTLQLASLASFGQNGQSITRVFITPGPYHPSWTNNVTYYRPSDTFHCGIQFPSDFNTRKCAVMLFFCGNPATSLYGATSLSVGYWQWAYSMPLDHITIPNSNDSMSILTVYLWDSVQHGSPDPGAMPGIRRWLVNNYGSHIDTTRFYLNGLSSGAAHVLGCISEQDSIARYVTAVIEMDGATEWKPKGSVDPFDNTTVYEGTATLLSRYNIHIWSMHASGDGTVPYTNATQWRDSCDKYAPGLNHLSTWPGGGHNSVWIPWSTDTAGPEPAYFHAVANTVGLGGKKFTDSYYQWLLQYPASPAVPPKVLPIIKHAANVRWDPNSEMYVLNFDAEHTELDKYYEVLIGDDYNHLHRAGVFYPHGDGAYTETFKP